jgi:ABC-type transporter MlaC component
VRELEADFAFNIQSYITKEFFAKVFLSLVQRQTRRRLSASTQTRRNIVERHFQEYVDITGFRRMPSFGGVNQISQYQGKAIEGAYLNNVQNGFGNQLRRVVNRLLNIKERAQQMKQSLIHEGIDEEEVGRRLRSDIYRPATTFKMAISRRRPRLSPNSPEYYTRRI